MLIFPKNGYKQWSKGWLKDILLVYGMYLSLLLLAACSPELIPNKSGPHYSFGPDTGLAYAVQPEPDSLWIYLRITDQTAIASLQQPDTHLTYFLSKNYDRQSIYQRDSILFINTKINKLPDEAALLTLALPAAKIIYPSVLILRVPQLSATQEETLLDIPLTQASRRPTLLLADSTGQAPLFQSYTSVAQPFTVLAGPTDTTVTIRQFPANFTPAAPPMAGSRPVPAATLKMQSKAVYYTHEPIQLNQPGIYLLESNSARTALLVEPGAFPALTTAEELIEPLIYLTSAAERKKLYQAPEPKRAVDAFWLDIAQQDQNRGKSLIREFYGRVEKANHYFSSHKAGWRTDRGMIYLVFGSPAYVNRFWDREEWRYAQSKEAGGEVKFIFLKKPNTFTQNHYELVRETAHEYPWYNQVDQWRKGMIGIPAPVRDSSGRRNRTE